MPPGSLPRFDAPRPVRYTIADLERETGVSARTIRFYITEGLLPPAYGRGPSATYDTAHLLRLRYIQFLKDERLSLSGIKERLSQLTDEHIAAAMQVRTRPEAHRWRRVLLYDGLELHVREGREAERDFELERAVDQIVDFADSALDDLGRQQ
ncbi:MAG: MerR family transcriptional regulator [Chloroflexia bacterium]|nr:MerR family transcriptional regulator [Chloroflexia bacterium]